MMSGEILYALLWAAELQDRFNELREQALEAIEEGDKLRAVCLSILAYKAQSAWQNQMWELSLLVWEYKKSNQNHQYGKTD